MPEARVRLVSEVPQMGMEFIARVLMEPSRARRKVSPLASVKVSKPAMEESFPTLEKV
jgi:hypothetical protein